MRTMIKLGAKVRDTVTGFEGIVISRTEYLNGCIAYGVKPPKDKDGKMIDAEWIDDGQLQELEARAPELNDAGCLEEFRAAARGGPSADTPPESFRG
jgi:hypothetical protein